jgi:large subunit ribosomal protein L24
VAIMMKPKKKTTGKLKLKQGDLVIVIAGKDKGKKGTIKTAYPAIDKVLVEGINLAKKHTRDNPQKNVQGGIISIERPIQVSNVAIYNPLTERADRIGYKILENGSKVRVYKSNGEQVDTK